MLKPVQFANWATPIVPVLKSDKKSVRICGDFLVTVNQVSSLDSYLLPKPEDCLLDWPRGKTFSILDLSQAYLQIELGKESRKFIAINTHKVFFSSPGYLMVFLPLQVYSNEPWKHCCKIFQL